MKKFSFRLQRVMDVRAATEKMKLAEFGKQQQILLQEQAKLDLFKNEELYQYGAMQSERQKAFSAWMFAVGNNYMRRLGKVIDFQSQRVYTQQNSVAAARNVYLDARRDTAILEKLREKKREEWRQGELLSETVLLDEVAANSRRNQHS
jgi:flagellar protein FliJ